MHLLRHLVLSALKANILVRAKHIRGKDNTIVSFSISGSSSHSTILGEPTHQHPTAPAALKLECLASDLLRTSALSSSSRATYKRAISVYSKFVKQTYNSEIVFPTPENAILTFISYLHTQHFSPATISTYVTALSYMNKLKGREDPTTSFLIKKLLVAVTRQSSRPDSRIPITLYILHDLIRVLPTVSNSSFNMHLFKTMFLTLFYGFLRIGKVTARNVNECSPLTLANCEFEYDNSAPTRVKLGIADFKHNQSKSLFQITISKTINVYCPVSALHEYLSLRGESPGSLFVISDG